MRVMGKTTLLACLVGVLAVFVPSPGVAAESEKYELESVGVSLTSVQAGAHADLTTTFELSEKGGQPYAQTRDVEVHLPPGMIGNPQGIPRCTVAQLGNLPEESECPVDSQVGIGDITVGGTISGTFHEPIYNIALPANGDVVARLGFFAGPYPALINVRLNPTDYSLVATVEGAPSAAGLIKAETTFWGVPPAPVHDEDRLTPLEALKNEAPANGRPSGLPEVPFLSNPTDCGMERQITITVWSYQLPKAPRSKSVPFPQIGGCGKLGFEPAFSAFSTNPEASAPTGLDAALEIPQDETPQGRATSALKRAVVTLPEGMTINSAAAQDLAGCSATEVGFETSQPPDCAEASKIGRVSIEVPALEHTLNGAIYQRTPEPASLFRFWLVTDEQGVRLKLPAEIEANPVTGQLTAVVAGVPSLGGLPQVPFSNIEFHVFGGPKAPLATPGCGIYQTHFQLTPWSGKPPVEGDTPMQITSGCGKGGFSPKLDAGTTSLRAGSFAPFVFALTRQDGEVNPQSLSVTLPQGLLAKLGSVPLCSDASAATGACPAGSQIGDIAAATGVGGVPLWIPQPGKAPTAVYLSGPYKGAPYSIVSVVPAQAGLFDLGLVINRAGIYVDPETAIATIKT
nr:hypothetical protein [Actinomycetota bacterium]